MMFFKVEQKRRDIWATCLTKFVTKNFQKSPQFGRTGSTGSRDPIPKQVILNDSSLALFKFGTRALHSGKKSGPSKV